jgi:hypothetical protein
MIKISLSQTCKEIWRKGLELFKLSNIKKYHFIQYSIVPEISMVITHVFPQEQENHYTKNEDI